MMDTQLTTITMLERAEKFFPNKSIVSRTASGIFRYTYKQMGKRVRCLSSSLIDLGIKRGDRVGTIAWNHHRHLETYFAIPNIGAVIHTINFRLSIDHLIYIINNAENKILFVDEEFIPLVEEIKNDIHTVEKIIVMTDETILPDSSLDTLISYENLIDRGNENFKFPTDLNENDPAGMCYTSATTGNPKGVVYTHRSTYLHGLTIGLADTVALSENDVVLTIVPMFHVNAWGIPYAGTWFGITHVLPGPNFTPEILLDLIEEEKVTFSAGVPTVWFGILQELKKKPRNLSSLRKINNGGSAAPKSMIREFEQVYNVPVMQGYGMTETGPLTSMTRIKSYQENLSYEEKLEITAGQGILAPGLDVKLVDDEGSEVPWDGESIGEIALRGPWITNSYYKEPEKTAEAVRDGWFYTGDIATISEEGQIKLVDRTKDLVKSGGEWISSVDLENALMAHESVFEATVIGVPHKKWQERPIAVVVLKEPFHGKITKEVLLDHLKDQFAKWWLPNDVVFVDEIPKTSVGKFLKRELRERFHNHLL